MNNKIILKKKINKFIHKYLSNYDYVYLTSDIRGFLKKYYPITAQEICNNLIFSLLNNNITVIIPTYTYTSSGKFYINKQNSNLGYITKWALKKRKVIRSEHPICSVCAIGKNSKIVNNIGRSAFGLDSIFDRLIKKNTSLLHFGRPFSYGNTVIHYVEQNVGTVYREHKCFKTRVYKKNKYIGTNFSAFVRKGKVSDKKFVSNTTKISKIISKKFFFKQIGNEKNLTNITHLDLKQTFDCMCREFYKNNKIFIN